MLYTLAYIGGCVLFGTLLGKLAVLFIINKTLPHKEQLSIESGIVMADTSCIAKLDTLGFKQGDTK